MNERGRRIRGATNLEDVSRAGSAGGVGRTRTDWATRRPWPSPQDTHVMKCPRRERRFVPPFYALPTAPLYILAMLYIRGSQGLNSLT